MISCKLKISDNKIRRKGQFRWDC